MTEDQFISLYNIWFTRINEQQKHERAIRHITR